MQGTWSMAFWGREADLDRLIAGVEAFKDDPACAYIYPLWKEAVDRYEKTGGDAENVLSVDSEEAGAISSIPDTAAAFRKFAPELHAACRMLALDYEEEGYDVWYLAPNAEEWKAIELRPVFGWEDDEDEDGVEYETAELVSGFGEPFICKVEKGYKFVLDMWEAW